MPVSERIVGHPENGPRPRFGTRFKHSCHEIAESPRGISPRGAHRTVLDRLRSHGSCHPIEDCRLPSGPSSSSGFPLTLTAPMRVTCSLCSTGITPSRRYYGAVRPCPVDPYFRPRGSAACTFSVNTAEQVLKFHTKARIRVTPPEHRAPRDR